MRGPPLPFSLLFCCPCPLTVPLQRPRLQHPRTHRPVGMPACAHTLGRATTRARAVWFVSAAAGLARMVLEVGFHASSTAPSTKPTSGMRASVRCPEPKTTPASSLHCYAAAGLLVRAHCNSVLDPLRSLLQFCAAFSSPLQFWVCPSLGFPVQFCAALAFPLAIWARPSPGFPALAFAFVFL